MKIPIANAVGIFFVGGVLERNGVPFGFQSNCYSFEREMHLVSDKC